MKITVECAKHEKEFLVNILNKDCPFLHDDSIKCAWSKEEIETGITFSDSCVRCIEKNIEWRIIE